MINRFHVEIIIEANGFTDVWVGTKRMKIILSLMGPRKLSVITIEVSVLNGYP